MPLTEDQEHNLDVLRQNINLSRQAIENMGGQINGQDALGYLATGGQRPDYDSISTEDLRTIYDGGVRSTAINTLSDGTDPDDPNKEGVQAHPHSVIAITDRGKATAKMSREELIAGMDAVLEAHGYDYDPQTIASAQSMSVNAQAADLDGRVERCTLAYIKMKEDIPGFSDPGIEAELRVLKAESDQFGRVSEQKCAEYVNAGLARKMDDLSYNGGYNADLAAQAIQTARIGLDATNMSGGTKHLAKMGPGAQLDMSQANLRGVDLSQSDLTGIRIDADTLSHASGLDTVRGVDPRLKAEAEVMQPHVQRLDNLERRLDRLENETGLRKNLLGNIRHLNHGGVEGEKRHLREEIGQAQTALQEARDQFARQPLPGNQNDFELKTTHGIGTDLHRVQAPLINQAMQGTQASDTFRVTSDVPLNDQGATTAFGKSLIGTKVARMQEAGADPRTLKMAQIQEGGNISNAAALFGTHEAVDDVLDATDIPGKVAAMGVDPTSLLSRSVATSALDKALGMNCMAEEKFGIDPQGGPVGISVGVAGAPILKAADGTDGQQTFLQADYEHPNVQKGLFDLEAQDYITGQSDRHTGNIFVDPHSNEVRGIDNDLAFPVVSRDAVMAANQQTTAKMVRDKPMFMHADTADKIEAMTPQALRQALGSIETPDGVAPLEPEAIEGAVQRLGELQDHIKDLRQEGRLVTEFNDDTYNAARDSQLAKEKNGAFGEFSHNLERTSYLGSAIIEREKTPVVNLDEKVDKHRNVVTKDDVDPASPVPPQVAAYQQAVATAKQDILANPQQLQDTGLAQTITDKARDVTDFERKLAADTEFMTKTQDSLKTAIEEGNEVEIADLRDTLKTIQEMRQETLQHLATAKTDLNSALDRAVDSQKPQIAQDIKAGRLQVNQEQNPAVNQAQNQGWQRITQPRQQPDPNRNFNLGQRQPSAPDLNAPVPANQRPERPQLTRPPGPPPPIPNQAGPVPAVANQDNLDEAKAKIKTQPRPALKRPDGPAPEPPVDAKKAAEPEVKAEKADAHEQENHKVKEDLHADGKAAKNEHARKNSVGAEIKWTRTAPSKGQDRGLGQK